MNNLLFFGEQYSTERKGDIFMTSKTILILCIAFLSLFVFMSVLPVNGEEEIYDNMIRLHVIANSNTKEDQALKLLVRDAILEKAITIKADDPDEAYIKTEASIDALEKAALDRIIEEGYNYDVKVTLSEERYPEREYSGFVLPEGTYTSLRVLIGEAEGQNWWCVLYPPLCTTAAEEREEAFVAAGFTGEQYEAITEGNSRKYKVKFKIVELIKDLFEGK